MYSITDYGRMLNDRVRVDAYVRALARVIRPGATVVDLGAGPGFFALEACRLGAARVIAIETNDAVSLLPPAARRLGWADRIEVVQRTSTEVTLERKADVIVADLRGVVPLFEAHLDVMADARARLLADGGVLVPRRDVLHAGLVEAPGLYDRIVGGWSGHAAELSEAREAALGTFHSDRGLPLDSRSLVTEGASQWAEVVYGAPGDSLFEGKVALTAARAATAHGIAIWFDAELVDGIGYSTRPGERGTYGCAFLPLRTPAVLERGDDVTLELLARRGMGDHVWGWSTEVKRGGAVTTSLRQSTFDGLLATARALEKESDGYAPSLGVRGRAVVAILSGMNGATSLPALAAAVHRAHPGAFASAAEALVETRRLARNYG
ncbi:MAG: 50S ribosomal protein L11 methyltransferase [Deltaproteobacteria bacterium]|nr:50S ribosomal protein L11 methyltransferase [Deltaproteobacteria bacterium]